MGKPMNEKFLKPYNPQETEGKIYQIWEASGYFNPDNLPGEREDHYTITLPPPNVTGILHLGHAYEDSLQDTAIRFHRMRGKKALWVPGTDSAAIATQARVEKNIQKEEGLSRHDLGRAKLVSRVSEFAKNSEDTILSQVKRMGASLDWSRYAYTLDDKRELAVFTAFKNMYDAGLIYRGHRIVNWDPKGQTTISDDEVVYEERQAKLYTFKYSKDFPIAISTTRPETKVGDVAVAVHPDDERYSQFVGQEYDAVFCDVPIHIKVVADKSVDPEFGTGALGVTPAHSHIDWEMSERHNLPRPQVINEYAKMSVPGRLNDKKTLEARELVAEWLRAENLMEKEEDVKQNLSLSERTGAVIEPLPKLQWWLSVNKKFAIPHSEIPGIQSGQQITLKELMLSAIESGAVDMPQENFRKTYSHWVENLRDWCLSRQIWFGHRIPVWYRGEELLCQIESPGADWRQEEDVLDTWFSSALWTFSTLGWPEKTKDLMSFHPTSFMSPAYEILSLWVSRMILMSGFHLGQIPFQKVVFHGLVRAKDGKKFSKSLNNGIDPIEMIDKYGADALRMGLMIGTAIGGDIKFDENKVKGYKNFANKVWNMTRFVLSMPTESRELKPELVEEFQALSKDVTDDMENYRFHLAGEKIYHYIWHRLADEILEESKKDSSLLPTIHHLLENSLKLLHPFMPFVTEEIWSELKKDNLLMIEPWPTQ